MTQNDRTEQTTDRSHVRWFIVALLVWVAMANYLDRSILANLAPEMPQYLHLADKVKPAALDSYWKDHTDEVLAAVHVTQQQAASDASIWLKCQTYMKEQIARKSWDEAYWNIQVAFTGAYALSMLVLGRLMDVVGLRVGFALACAIWTVGAMLQSIAPEIGNLLGNVFIGFFLCRIVLGFGEEWTLTGSDQDGRRMVSKRENGLWLPDLQMALRAWEACWCRGGCHSLSRNSRC